MMVEVNDRRRWRYKTLMMKDNDDGNTADRDADDRDADDIWESDN